MRSPHSAPTREAVLARELTKLFETVIAGTLGEIAARVDADANQQRGEFVLLVVAHASAMRMRSSPKAGASSRSLREELAPAKAAKLAAAITGAPRKALYQAD